MHQWDDVHIGTTQHTYPSIENRSCNLFLAFFLEFFLHLQRFFLLILWLLLLFVISCSFDWSAYQDTFTHSVLCISVNVTFVRYNMNYISVDGEQHGNGCNLLFFNIFPEFAHPLSFLDSKMYAIRNRRIGCNEQRKTSCLDGNWRNIIAMLYFVGANEQVKDKERNIRRQFSI